MPYSMSRQVPNAERMERLNALQQVRSGQVPPGYVRLRSGQIVRWGSPEYAADLNALSGWEQVQQALPQISPLYALLERYGNSLTGRR